MSAQNHCTTVQQMSIMIYNLCFLLRISRVSSEFVLFSQCTQEMLVYHMKMRIYVQTSLFTVDDVGVPAGVSYGYVGRGCALVVWFVQRIPIIMINCWCSKPKLLLYWLYILCILFSPTCKYHINFEKHNENSTSTNYNNYKFCYYKYYSNI